ncbi:MAG: multicopper oxidase domain-containing protein [Pseudomonadota bacterium]
MNFYTRTSVIRRRLPGALAVLAGLALYTGVQAQEYSPKYVLDVQETGNMKTYNGVYPGPVMRVAPGEALDVELINSLPVLNDDCTDNMNSEHGLNTTNLHPHGLHVSPDFDSTGKYFSDNVFVSLVPEGQVVECESDKAHGQEHHGMPMHYVWGSAKYRFELPADHMSGTFWYHAHKHGSTASQVGQGLAGPLIVEDPPGTLPEYIEQANEKILVLGNRGLYLGNI